MENSFNDIGINILKCAFEIHKEIGPGLLESSYKRCLEYELINNGLIVRNEVGLPLL